MLMRITIDVPNITEQATAGKLQEVIDYLNILASDLNDMLANIDTDNLSNNLLGQIGKSESVDVSGFASVGYVEEVKSTADSALATANSAVGSAAQAYALATNASSTASSANSTASSAYSLASSTSSTLGTLTAWVNQLDGRVSALESK